MISWRIEANQLAQIGLICEAKFGDNPLSYTCNCLFMFIKLIIQLMPCRLGTNSGCQFWT